MTGRARARARAPMRTNRLIAIMEFPVSYIV
jgi:hypothetical protein